MVTGVDLSRLRVLSTADSDYTLSPSVLRAAMEADVAAGLVPCAVFATMGTTSSCAFDPLDEIGPVCVDHQAWLHVDGAYAGVSMVCEEYRPLVRASGLAFADSFDCNPHKVWGLPWSGDAG